MSNILDSIRHNYEELEQLLGYHYKEVKGEDFYRYIFPNNQNKGEYSGDYSKPNGVYLYKEKEDEKTNRTLRRRIMLSDTWKDDYNKYIKENPMTLCNGIAYRGRTNRLEQAQKMNALVFDLDSVGKDELLTLFLRIGQEPGLRRLPQPTFLVMSGTGLHIYYVFDESIDLYPNIKLQLKKLKYDLTFKIWEYKATSKEKQIQYQSINQGFRMVGSINSKYGLEVKAFKTGDRVSLDYINKYVDEKENMVDINRPFRPTKYTREEAKEKFPEWYQRVIVEKNRNKKKWNIKKDLYNWWLKQSHNAKGGHRYFYLMCIAIYGVKCNVPKEEVEKDMYEKFEELKNIEHSNPLTKSDIKSALETYDRQYYNFKIDDIEKLTDVRIERNKRNYRKQNFHLRIARSTLEIMNEENGQALQGRPVDSGTKEEVVKEYIEKNPSESNISKIAKELNISRPTVYKYLK